LRDRSSTSWPVRRLARAAIAPVLALALPLAAGASKPCHPDTWYFRPDAPAAERREHARWVVVGTVVERHERKEPYPNCALKDRSLCAVWDRSELVVAVERWEKGDGPKTLRLVAGQCAIDPPGEARGRYRFYGLEPSAYMVYEQLPATGRRDRKP
jgi:hypothetical protein